MDLRDTFGKYMTFQLGTAMVSSVLALLVSTCAADELPVPEICPPGTATYESNIQEIIGQSCAYMGCHDGSSPIAPGDFRTYSGLRIFIRDGTFRTRVIDLRDDPVQGMPPSRAAYPQSQKENLTDTEFELIQCWVNGGFPER